LTVPAEMSASEAASSGSTRGVRARFLVPLVL